jgi:hypothetical protein
MGLHQSLVSDNYFTYYCGLPVDDYSLLISLKLQYRESPSTMWSTRSMPITAPAAASRLVSS